MARYSRKAGSHVAKEMRRFKKSGPTRRMKSRKQAVAIGLSKARKSGAKVPAK